MPPPDTGLFRAINDLPQSMAPTMQFFSEALNRPWVKVVLGLLLLGMLLANRKTRTTVIQALIAAGIANGWTDVLKDWFPRHRPFQELQNVHLWVGWSPSNGTASAHSANMAAVAFVFVYNLKWWGSPWVVIALIVGFSRVYCGAHYPYQVVLGWFVGIFVAFIVTKSWELIQTRRQNVVSTDEAPKPN